MIFTLEALSAKHGDSLLLHYGDGDVPNLIIVDGGPAGVARKSLFPRIEQLRRERNLAPAQELPIRLLMVSHIDDDHIRGILDLTNALCEAQDDQKPLPYRIQTLWHNSFDDILGNHADNVFRAASAGVGGASLGAINMAKLPISRDGAVLLASVPQGRRLRDNARRLGLDVNGPGGRLIVGQTAGEDALLKEAGLRLNVVGPGRERVQELQEEWDKILERRGLATKNEAEAAAYVDTSVYNLASIVVLAELDGKRMLLTGDGRGDDILAGLEQAGLLENGTIHVDILKMPHHGSSRNVETDFFRRVTADRYVFSADGRHHNPDIETFKMIFKARGTQPFTIFLTYPVDGFKRDYPKEALLDFFEQQRQAGRNFEIFSPQPQAHGIRIDLLDPLS